MSHAFLGMIMLRVVENKCVTVDMKKYVEDCIKDFEEEQLDVYLKKVNTPAASYLFKTRKNSVEKFSICRKGIFYSTVAKLLFMAKRAWPDILFTVLFLTTREKEPDQDDCNKLI